MSKLTLLDEDIPKLKYEQIKEITVSSYIMPEEPTQVCITYKNGASAEGYITLDLLDKEFRARCGMAEPAPDEKYRWDVYINRVVGTVLPRGSIHRNIRFENYNPDPRIIEKQFLEYSKYMYPDVTFGKPMPVRFNEFNSMPNVNNIKIPNEELVKGGTIDFRDIKKVQFPYGEERDTVLTLSNGEKIQGNVDREYLDIKFREQLVDPDLYPKYSFDDYIREIREQIPLGSNKSRLVLWTETEQK